MSNLVKLINAIIIMLYHTSVSNTDKCSHAASHGGGSGTGGVDHKTRFTSR